ncbi:MAG: type II secretion system protein [Thermodesulfobacteriota bacterium]|nr:type II secretion system protein [Thermodesulfobacteriota bacterium]
MNKRSKSAGFTLIEILLVVVIIGIMLAVIVPRAWRANIDTKYGLVRQNGSELASFAMNWAEQMILAQEPDSTAVIHNYMTTLCGTNNRNWVATAVASNWNSNLGPYNVGGRNPSAPESSVQDIIPPEKTPRNPFNGVSIFSVPNDPPSVGTLVVGSLFGASFRYTTTGSGDPRIFTLLFQGTDNTTTNQNLATTFHAGQDTNSLGGVRNGIFIYQGRR